jgi:cytochrome c oxidase cbb3-type subunit 1
MSSDSHMAAADTDTTARGPLSLLLASSLAWLVVAVSLGLVHAIQRHTPSFLETIPAFTYGRTQAMYETALIFGWAANAAYAVALWILARLGGGHWRGLGLMTGGTLFWNAGVTIGIFCIGWGEGTMLRFLQMPAYVHPLLLVSGAAISTPAILAWTGRRTSGTYVAQWYAIGALFLFPWFYSASQVMLLADPVSGVSRAIIGAWHAQNVLSLWLAPIALAAAYYLLPRLTGKPVPHYGFAGLGFWVLIVVGSWTGGRHLVGGPVPAWIPATGIAAAVLLLFHFMLVWMNLSPALRAGTTDPLRFVRAGIVAYLAGGVLDALVSLEGAAARLQFTHFQTGLQQLFVQGAFGLLVLGAIYDLVPRLTGRAWPSPRQIRGHYVLALTGTALSVAGLLIAGWIQGGALLHADASFAAIAASTRPWLYLASAGELTFLLGAMVASVHLARLLLGLCRLSAAGQSTATTVTAS